MIKIMKLCDTPVSSILARGERITGLEDTVSSIISDVRARGDAALMEYCEKFDGVKLSSLEVPAAEIKAAADGADPEFRGVLERAAENIRAFHVNQVRSGFILNNKKGVVTGQKVVPIHRAGLYIPGGTAAYPSSVLMNAIPAKIAGCGEIIMTTPPGKDGKVNPAILAAAYVAGVDRVFAVGGAQAVAAMAYGTETIPRADKIVGPGNAYVAEAKRQVFGAVSIDMIAGPSEILIIADKNTPPSHAAADLLSQAEHDRLASAVLVTDSEELAYAVRDELERQIPLLERKDIARASIDANGKIIITGSLSEAVEISNELAPEHLELCVDSPFDILDGIENAGSVFLGRNCPEALGDYFAGPNHTLPTGGTARFSSPLSVDDFVKKIQYTYYSAEAFGAVAEDVAFFARTEGLTAHAESALIRTEGEKK